MDLGTIGKLEGAPVDIDQRLGSRPMDDHPRNAPENGSVGIDQAASRLSVSAATIRRDLQRLESEQLLARTQGGAVARGVLFELPLRYRGGHSQEEKVESPGPRRGALPTAVPWA